MRNKSTGAYLFVGALMLAATAAGGRASAQEPMATSPSAVAECLCAQQGVSIIGRELRAERRRYDASRDAEHSLDNQMRTSRGNVDVNNRGDIEAYKALIERHEEARHAFNAETGRYSAAVAAYNRAVAHNNAACTGRLFDPAEVASIRATLSCPRP
jgi:hypothetical protein